MPTITIYSSATCADCKTAKAFFTQHKIPFTDKPVEEEVNLKELGEKYKRLATPTIIIDDQVFVGFSNNLEAIVALKAIAALIHH
jgi:glutaredoxin 3